LVPGRGKGGAVKHGGKRFLQIWGKGKKKEGERKREISSNYPSLLKGGGGKRHISDIRRPQKEGEGRNTRAHTTSTVGRKREEKEKREVKKIWTEFVMA